MGVYNWEIAIYIEEIGADMKEMFMRNNKLMEIVNACNKKADFERKSAL